jgi:hypothetical protein
VPTYLRLDPYLGFFCGSKFVGYVDVPWYAHTLETKHYVTFFDPLDVDSLIHAITWFKSHVLKLHRAYEGIDLKEDKFGTKYAYFLNHLHWSRLCQLKHSHPQAWGMFTWGQQKENLHLIGWMWVGWC